MDCITTTSGRPHEFSGPTGVDLNPNSALTRFFYGTGAEFAGHDVERRERGRVRAEKAWSEWQGQWSTALSDLRLASDLAPDAVGTQIEVVDLMRDWAERINHLRHDRIDKINRDVADFESVVGEIVQQVAEDLEDQPADDAVLEIEKRLAEAQRVHGLQEIKKEEVARAHLSNIAAMGY